MRIVSLLPSATEIVSVLGFQHALVGRSHECDYPKGIENLPVCSEPKFNPHPLSGREIHEAVNSIVEESLSVYRVHSEKLNELKPDFIVTQAQCEVCAVSLKDVERAVCEMTQSRPQIISLNPSSLEDVFNEIKMVSKRLGAPQKGEETVRSLQVRIDKIKVQAAKVSYRVSVACIEWMDPLISAGNWIPEMVSMLHGSCLFAQAGKHSPKMSFDDLRKADPDIIIGMPCGWGLGRCYEELKLLARHPHWKDLKAVKTGQVFATDGNQYFNRPGPRLVESLEILAEIMHPGLFHFGHGNQGWIKFH